MSLSIHLIVIGSFILRTLLWPPLCIQVVDSVKFIGTIQYSSRIVSGYVSSFTQYSSGSVSEYISSLRVRVWLADIIDLYRWTMFLFSEMDLMKIQSRPLMFISSIPGLYVSQWMWMYLYDGHMINSAGTLSLVRWRCWDPPIRFKDSNEIYMPKFWSLNV